MRSTKYLHILPKLVLGSALSYIMDFAGLNPDGYHEILVTDSSEAADHEIHCSITMRQVEIGYIKGAIDDWTMSGLNPDYVMLYDVDPSILQYDKGKYRTVYMANDATPEIVEMAEAKLNLVKDQESADKLDNAIVYKPYVCRKRISEHFSKERTSSMFIGISAGNRYKFPYDLVAGVIELVDPDLYEVGITDLRLTGTTKFNDVVTKAISDNRITALCKYTLTTPVELYNRADVLVDVGGFRTAVEAGIFNIPLTHKHKSPKKIMEEIDAMRTDEAYLTQRKKASREFCKPHLLDVNLQRLESKMKELV